MSDTTTAIARDAEPQTAAAIGYVPEPDPNSPFATDLHINVSSIDGYLGIVGVAYRDVRMVEDSARYEDVGGDSLLTATIEGFEVAPYPLIGTLGSCPVCGAYDSDSLFHVEWASGDEISSATPNYEESMQIVERLFPKDQTIFVMCGAGGYAEMTKLLLEKLGWDGSRIFNLGGFWDYRGSHAVDVVERHSDGTNVLLDSGIKIHPIEFGSLTPIAR